MDLWTLIITIACGIAVVQSFFLSAYIFLKDQKQATPTFFLGILLLGLALRIGKSYFYYVFENYFEWGKILGAIGLWAIGPSFLLFTLASKPKTISLKHYGHYIPVVLIIFLCSIMRDSLGRFYFWGVFTFLAYFLLSLYVYYFEEWNGNKNRFQLFASSVGVICISFVVQVLTGGAQVYAIGSVIAVIVLYRINFLILKDNNYLRPQSTTNKKVDPTQKTKIVSALETLFEQNKIYRQKGLTIATVSKSIAFPSYQVSKTINQHFGIKFNEFVNQYRVEDAKRRLQDFDKNEKIEVIAKEVGFSSTSSLYNAFKKEMKLTPQGFRKQLKSAK